jgi:hypothetical protein
VERYYGYLGGGTTTMAMAIVVNVVMGDHQNYVCLVFMVVGLGEGG